MSNSRLDRLITLPENFSESSNNESAISEKYLSFYESIGDEIDRQHKEAQSNLEKVINTTIGGN